MARPVAIGEFHRELTKQKFWIWAHFRRRWTIGGPFGFNTLHCILEANLTRSQIYGFFLLKKMILCHITVFQIGWENQQY